MSSRNREKPEVEIRFRTKKLAKQYADHKQATKVLGEEVARKYIQRIQIMSKARSFDEVRKLPGLGCHPLKGHRKGQYAIRLTERMRLIFSLQGERLQILFVEEVSKHYGD